MRSLPWTALALCAVVACKPAPPTLQPGDPALLAGVWDFRLEHDTAPAMTGTFILRAIDYSDTTQVPAGWAVEPKEGILAGAITVETMGWLTTPVQNHELGAAMYQDGTAQMAMRISGRCENCGNLQIEVTLVGDSGVGRWEQDFVSGRPTGRFVMARIPAPPSP